MGVYNLRKTAMNTTYKLLIALLLILVSSAQPASAQDIDTPRVRSLKGKHGLQVNLGVLGQASTTNQISFAGLTTESNAKDFSGSVAYTYWFERDWAVHASIGFLDADVTTSIGGDRGTLTESAGVVPILLGLRYYPSELAPSTAMRPYLAGAIGPYLGYHSRDRIGFGIASDYRSETAAGAYAGAGIDWFVGNIVKIGLNGGYHFVSDFDRPIGTEENFSGAEFSVTVGFIFGKSKP